MNTHCPQCGEPLTPGEIYHDDAGMVTFCTLNCHRMWYRKHDRRSKDISVAYDRRFS